ncbi:MAG: ClbS/DfsB family four-helix bundle protein [Chloroflexota bacterium]|nr:ClbS/DfsB family four-helix bundle protein [Chloroflexota bacterium]
MTRDEILQAIEHAHTNLVAGLIDIPEGAMATQPVVDWWTLKDLIGHIAMWYHVAVKFIDEYLRDGVPVPLGLKDDAALDAYNKRGAALRRDWSLARVRGELDAAHRDLVAAVEKLTDAQLNAPLPAPWDNGANLARLIAVNSYEHALEHTEHVLKWRGDYSHIDGKETHP